MTLKPWSYLGFRVKPNDSDIQWSVYDWNGRWMFDMPTKAAVKQRLRKIFRNRRDEPFKKLINKSRRAILEKFKIPPMLLKDENQTI